MAKRIALFWPGDGRAKPNELALPSVEEATAQIERALKKLGREPYRVPGFLSKPHEAIEKLGPIDDPMVGVCVHWFYGPHTTDGVVGKDNPLLLASNFSGQWPGLVGLLNTGRVPREPRPRVLARLDRRAGLCDRRRVHGAPRRVVHDGTHRATRKTKSCITRPSRPRPRRARDGRRRRSGARRRSCSCSATRRWA